MRTFERVLVALDQGLFGALYRIGVGYLIVPAWSEIVGKRGASWTLIAFFVAVLLALRVVPAILRKLLPFSSAVRTVWADRRQMAKRVDSYQWRKLFWIGVGLALVTLRSDTRSPELIGLTFTCLVTGAIGEMVWRYRPAGHQVHSIA